MADYLTLHETRNGVLLDYDSDDKTPSACTGDCAAFKGIAYRYLAKLYERDTTRTDYYEVLEASRNAIVAHDFSAKSGTFGTRWDEGGLLAENRLAANASAVMALQIYAELPPPSPAP
jgi:predicted alpha-1,6-mannanase (GH76 family)